MARELRDDQKADVADPSGLTYQQRYYLKHRQKKLAYARERAKKHMVSISEYQRAYREQNKETLKIKKQLYDRKREEVDLDYKLRRRLRARIRHAVKHQSVKTRTPELLGADINIVRLHIEARFLEGMSWENYGQWEIDHIIPLVRFDLTSQDEQRKAFHYTNLQPLWKEDNRRKGIR